MYSSLDKLDLGVGPKHGRYKALIQTDHRSAAEIVDEAPLSVVFAVTRCLIARAAGDADPALQPYRVVYQLDAEPPAFLAYAVGAAGAVVAADALGELPEPTPVRIPELVALIDDACARHAASLQVPPTFAAVVAFEQGLAAGDNEHAFHTAIVSLGALVAAYARTKAVAATWRHVAGDVVPFRLAPPNVADAQSLPVFALAQRYLVARRAGTADLADAPSTLLGMMFGEITSITL